MYKNIILVFLALKIILSSFFFSQQYSNITLLDHWHEDSISTNSSFVRYSGCWGFRSNGTDYAVIGSTEGTHIFKISENKKLEFIDFVKGRYSSSMVSHREYKTFNNYLYAVCDEGFSSLQIIDLSHLPDSVSVSEDLYLPPFGRTHNLFIDTNNALLYLCKVTPFLDSTQLASIPMRVFSLDSPSNPTLLWEGPNDISEVHDVYVHDNEAILNCGFDGIRSYDFSNPSSPIFFQSLEFYNDQGYNHQGWLSPNKETYLFSDENKGMRIKKYRRLDDGSLIFESLFGTNSYSEKTPHNIQCDNEFAYVAYYNDGLRVFDMRVLPPQEIAYYNTYHPIISSNSSFTMNGAWGVHKYNNSHIIVSDRQNGLFLFDFNRLSFSIPQNISEIYPNPSTQEENTYFRFPNNAYGLKELSIFDSKGKKIKELSSSEDTILKTKLKKGFYCIRFCYKNAFDEKQQHFLSLIVL